MLSFFHDLAAALRSFRRHPAFPLAVVVTLALGFAPNCVIFAIMDSLYFRPLPYPEQQGLVLLNLSTPKTRATREVDAYTLTEWQRRSASFEAVAAYRNQPFNVNPGNRPERLGGQLVTPGFFRALGVVPALGRGFRDGDALPGAPRVLVISHATWVGSFSGRPDIVGLAVRVDSVPTTIVGVMPPSFTSFMEGRTARAWMPMTIGGARPPDPERAGNAVARLRSGVSQERARAELATVQAGLAREFPDFYRDRAAVLRDFRGSLFGGLGPGIRMLSVVVALLLVIACGNVANLLLARGVQRAREVAVRTALGASRPQVVRGLVAESLVLAVAAALLGLLLTYWGTRAIWAATAPIFQAIGVDAITFDDRIVVFAALLALPMTLLFGALPAMKGSRVDVATTLRDAAPSRGGAGRRSWTSGLLVVVQVALCVTTMIGTTLMLRSFLHFSRVSANPGFRPQALLVATLPQPAEPTATPAVRLALLEDIERRIASMPGTARVAMTGRVPFLEGGTVRRIERVAAEAGAGTARSVEADLRAIDDDYFGVLSVPLRRGRVFTPRDNASGLPVVILSDRLAGAMFGAAEPVGDRVVVDGIVRTVVGIVGSTIEPSPFRPPAREAFVPYLQVPPGDMRVLIRSSRPLETLAPLIRQQVQAADPDQPVVELRTMEEALSRFMTPFRLLLGLMALFGAIALSLAAVGLYGVVSHGVSRRTREIGVRMAVGATRQQVVRMVVRSGVRLAAVGVALGLLLGLAIATILPAEILGVRGLSVFHYAATVLLWAVVSVIACVIPARRAARIDPLEALRAE